MQRFFKGERIRVEAAENTSVRVKRSYQRTLSPGEVIFDEGDPGDQFYVIQSGEVELIRDRFESGEVDAVYLISSKFRSAMSTPPHTRELLPIEGDPEAPSADVYILSPSVDMILERILPAYIRNAVYTAMVENAALEESRRM